MKKIFLIIFLVNYYFSSISQDLKTDSFFIFFSSYQTKLDLSDIKKLDFLFSGFKPVFTYSFSVYSISSFENEQQYFEENALVRSNNVINYLISKGVGFNDLIEVKQITETNNNLPSHIFSNEYSNIYVKLLIHSFEVRNQPHNLGLNQITGISIKEIEKNGLGVLKKGDNIDLGMLNFEPGRHTLLNESKSNLDKLLQLMQKYPSLKIEIQGHICCPEPGEKDGFDKDNSTYRLSYNRAEFVYNYLKDNGINKNRMTFFGFAHLRPLVEEIDDKTRAVNRRVEIKVVETKTEK